ncbi:MAG: hypothetical protein CMO55_23270 [Verrucomicrobiales bacterium]|nr:hypothetical protein [Verrucomicrobiales bacterium]
MNFLMVRKSVRFAKKQFFGSRAATWRKIGEMGIDYSIHFFFSLCTETDFLPQDLSTTTFGGHALTGLTGVWRTAFNRRWLNMNRLSPVVPICLLLVAFFCRPLAWADDGDSVVLEWRFDGEEEPGEWQGKAAMPKNEAPGPRPPRYPGFEETNEAAFFPGYDAWMVVKDKERGGAADIRFRKGETLTMESWLKIQSIGKGHMIYLLGKGRSGDRGEKLGGENQNYSFRLKGTDNGAQLGILFTTEHPETKERTWHRWWSKKTVPASGWHHVALSITFGKGDSLRAYIDGKAVDGVWDLEGPTDLPPVTDAADLIIGTGFNRGSASSFSGWMDNLIIRRGSVSDEEMATRYSYQPPPPPVSPDMVPEGKVLVQISEKGVPASNGWPDEPEVTETYEEEVFGFFEEPQKYVSTGVRGDRLNPHHFRAAGTIELPKGTHRLLLRGRGATRLFVDGKKVMETPPRPPDPGGYLEISVQDNYLDLGPDFRFVPPGNREEWCEFTSAGGEHFFILETVVGGIQGKNKQRPELGETVAAISLEGEESWSLLSPGARHVPYTDEGWAAYEAERREWFAEVNAKARAEKRAEHAGYWSKRREAAKEWLNSADPIEVPALPAGYPAHNAIDHFLAARIVTAASEAESAHSGSVDFFKDVRPILEARCFDCHQGGKAKGELRLDNRASALAGGENDGPAVVPHDVDGSSLIWRVTPEDAADDIMPPKGDPLTESEIATLTKWIEEGAAWPEFRVDHFELTSLATDLAFLRRVFLDTVGVPPTESEIAAFLDMAPDKRRSDMIDQLLEDPRWADHWMGYWQDVLAENPNILNPTLNNTGPFRWWLYESLLDNKPADLFVTELVRMEGSERFGGPAGFGVASQNDVPMAAKGIIVSSAFLGVEMKCARCHDAPSNVSKQEDLFQLAALLKKSPIEVPKTSSVPMDRIHEGGRKPLIEVTLQPGAKVEPTWPFSRYCEEDVALSLAENSDDPRDQLAALITAPQNERFAQVMVNRIWQRLMGRGIVENLSDWEKSEPTHPALLAWLGRRFVESGYDMKEVARLVMNSHAYQRANEPGATATNPLYTAPAPRRLSAEQIVDSLFSATGKRFDLEEVSLDIDSVRTTNVSITLGKPHRSWMLASTSNERDRPSLSLPRIQAVASVMESFGWRGARQDPVSVRSKEPNTLQPAILANGTMGLWLTRLSDDHGVTQLALEDQSVEQLVDRLFLRLLTRPPTKAEKEKYVAFLSDGYESRIVPEAKRGSDIEPAARVPERYVSWSNHVDGPANLLAQEKEAAARKGDPPSGALDESWRVHMEDVLWALLNSPEWVYTP